MSLLILTIQRGGDITTTPDVLWTNIGTTPTLTEEDTVIYYKGTALPLSATQKVKAFHWLMSDISRHNQLAFIKTGEALTDYLTLVNATEFNYNPLYVIGFLNTKVYHHYDGHYTYQGTLPEPQYNPDSYPTVIQKAWGNMDIPDYQMLSLLDVVWSTTTWHDISFTPVLPIQAYDQVFPYKRLTLGLSGNQDIVIDVMVDQVRFTMQGIDYYYYVKPTLAQALESSISTYGDPNQGVLYVTHHYPNTGINANLGDYLVVLNESNGSVNYQYDGTDWQIIHQVADGTLPSILPEAELTLVDRFMVFFHLIPTLPEDIPSDIPLSEDMPGDEPTQFEDFDGTQGGGIWGHPPPPRLPPIVLPPPSESGLGKLRIRRVLKLPRNPKPHSLYLVPSATEPDVVDIWTTTGDETNPTLYRVAGRAESELMAMIAKATTACIEVYFVANITQRDQLMGQLQRSAYFFVNDARFDPTVDTGSAMYLYNHKTKRLVKVFERESLDVILHWSHIEGRPISDAGDIDLAVEQMHSHANKELLDTLRLSPEGFAILNGVNYQYVYPTKKEW